MTRLNAVILIVAVAFSAAALFRISYRVEGLEDRLSGLNRQIVAEREAIRVLEAEWAYLTRPDRLRRLAAFHTDLAPLGPDQMIEDAGRIPHPLPGVGGADDVRRLMTLVDAPGLDRLPLPPRRPGVGSPAAPEADGPRFESMSALLATVAAETPAVAEDRP